MAINIYTDDNTYTLEIQPPPDRRRAEDVRRLVLIGSLMAKSVHASPDPVDRRLANAWEQQLTVTRPSLTGKTEDQ